MLQGGAQFKWLRPPAIQLLLHEMVYRGGCISIANEIAAPSGTARGLGLRLTLGIEERVQAMTHIVGRTKQRLPPGRGQRGADVGLIVPLRVMTAH